MGWQYEENIFWPKEKPSWTSSALIIAADSLFNFSKASDLFIVNQSTFIKQTIVSSLSYNLKPSPRALL